jgi:hypothetical protein
LKLFKNAGAPNLQKGALPTKAGLIRQALVDAIELYTNGIWKLVLDEETETDITDFSGEEYNDEEIWEDID